MRFSSTAFFHYKKLSENILKNGGKIPVDTTKSKSEFDRPKKGQGIVDTIKSKINSLTLQSQITDVSLTPHSHGEKKKSV
jgi:hypothetical protein